MNAARGPPPKSFRKAKALTKSEPLGDNPCRWRADPSTPRRLRCPIRPRTIRRPASPWRRRDEIAVIEAVLDDERPFGQLVSGMSAASSSDNGRVDVNVDRIPVGGRARPACSKPGPAPNRDNSRCECDSRARRRRQDFGRSPHPGKDESGDGEGEKGWQRDLTPIPRRIRCAQGRFRSFFGRTETGGGRPPRTA